MANCELSCIRFSKLHPRKTVKLKAVKALSQRRNLTANQYASMKEMLATLTPAERRKLKDPGFITEDEADIIVCNRRRHEPTVSLDKLLAEEGIPRRRHRLSA